MDGVCGFACTMLEYLVHAPMHVIASAQIPINVQGNCREPWNLVISLSSIFCPIFYMFLFEQFAHENAVFYFSRVLFVGSFFMLVVTTIIFALRVH
ncbi:hypothetical protein [Bartonella koehlerae]|uniref:Uncharacterized protein n=1 Tax=Bartonella koehlerae C-29 TaxID=1134510 RepID=A0A067W429_9HYPH|nr:hypothetical protein [Bartonella koehlerae]KEC54645.1 hypothetical protein O9A_01259 [Bartonella koehlerae C-29]